MRLAPAVCLLAAAAALSAPSARAQIALGAEFQVNVYTTDLQGYPSVAADAAGNFIVVWESATQDGSGLGVFGRRFLASGTPVGASEFRVNSYTLDDQSVPAVASDPSGRTVVVWSSYLQDGSFGGVYARRYDAAGVAGPEFRVNDYTTKDQIQPSVGMDGAGNFVVVWVRGDGGSEVFGRRFDAAGAAQGPEFQVNTYTTGGQLNPQVAMDAAGGFVVVWLSTIQNGDGVFGQRFDAAGAAQGPEFQVNTYTTSAQRRPAVAMNGSGEFVVAWMSDGQDGDGYGVFGRKFDAAGIGGSEFQVNQATTHRQEYPGVAVEPDGRFVVAWSSGQSPASGYDVFGRRYDAAAQPEGNEFRLNSHTAAAQRFPRVAPQGQGRFVVAWESAEDGSGLGVEARRFASDLIFRDGFESGDLSKWSSASSDGGDLFVTSTAAMRSTTAGLAGLVDDTTSLYVQDDSPADETRYNARFYLDTGDFDPGEASGAHRTRVFLVFEEAPTRRLAAVVLKRQGGLYSIEGRARLDDGSQADTGFFALSPGPHAVELSWRRESAVGASDGSFQLWIDGVSQATLVKLANNRSTVDFVRLGALSVKNGASGTLSWDEFESRRLNSIGN